MQDASRFVFCQSSACGLRFVFVYSSQGLVDNLMKINSIALRAFSVLMIRADAAYHFTISLSCAISIVFRNFSAVELADHYDLSHFSTTFSDLAVNIKKFTRNDSSEWIALGLAGWIICDVISNRNELKRLAVEGNSPKSFASMFHKLKLMFQCLTSPFGEIASSPLLSPLADKFLPLSFCATRALTLHVTSSFPSHTTQSNIWSSRRRVCRFVA